jgi:hypothetical protein
MPQRFNIFMIIIKAPRLDERLVFSNILMFKSFFLSIVNYHLEKLSKPLSITPLFFISIRLTLIQ